MTARSRSFRQLVEPFSPAEKQETQEAQEAQETPKRDPVRILLLAALFLAVVGGFFLIRWRTNQNPRLPDNYLMYTEDVDPYKDNRAVIAARRFHRESTRPISAHADAGCDDPVFEERTYQGTEAARTWWVVYCPEDGRPTWLTEHAE